MSQRSRRRSGNAARSISAVSLGAIALIVDTATTATGGLEPWGPKMVALIHQLRAMLSAYPELAIVLVVHLSKPKGNGRFAERQITDVLGDWGKWADALLLMEDEGDNKTKLSTYKRVGQQRRIVAKREGGLLVDPARHQRVARHRGKVARWGIPDLGRRPSRLRYADLVQHLKLRLEQARST